ncbi:hypothetical protein OOK29_10095 [Streptomyces phaeochromogenes]|uniref:hypothetical protein n=1 Tax=Streptomyces phaeochromogenes TaxID=1923 RepID=UPI0022582FA9|nr:hypothetical protein [Streptomyces phaeochromogenes]MCX5598490.1 hypothetical protein [Streptomyces phaeochromogenes]
MRGRKASNALDTAAIALHNTGKRVAGEKGVQAAQAVSSAALGRRLERCSDKCGHCNVPCVNGTCNH